MTCFTSISSLHIRRWRNTVRHTRGHPRSWCKVKRSMKWSRSYKHDVKHPVIHLNTKSIGRATPQLTTHGCPTRTYTHQTSLRNSMLKEGRFRQLKGEENGYEDSSSPSHVFPQQQLQQLPLSWSDHSSLPRRRYPSTNTTNGGTYCEHRTGCLDV
jgi:hypothetical protein